MTRHPDRDAFRYLLCDCGRWRPQDIECACRRVPDAQPVDVEALRAAAEREPPPSFLAKASRYTVAWSRWQLAARPTREQPEIERLLAICHACRHYDPDGQACSKCGCCVNARGAGHANKLAMKTESCPIGKW